MSHFSTTTESKVDFDKGAIHTIGLSGGSSYRTNIFITTRDNNSINMSFQDNNELEDFLNMVVTAAVKMNWSMPYPSANVYSNETDKITTIDDIKGWRRKAEMWDDDNPDGLTIEVDDGIQSNDY